MKVSMMRIFAILVVLAFHGLALAQDYNCKLACPGDWDCSGSVNDDDIEYAIENLGPEEIALAEQNYGCQAADIVIQPDDQYDYRVMLCNLPEPTYGYQIWIDADKVEDYAIDTTHFPIVVYENVTETRIEIAALILAGPFPDEYAYCFSFDVHQDFYWDVGAYVPILVPDLSGNPIPIRLVIDAGYSPCDS